MNKPVIYVNLGKLQNEIRIAFYQKCNSTYTVFRGKIQISIDRFVDSN